jgi:hypothetical protein
MELGPARAHELRGIGQAERNEQQPGLVDVAIVAVEDRDLGRVAVQAVQAVRGDQARGHTAGDQDTGVHASIVVTPSRGVIGVTVQRRAADYARAVRRDGRHSARSTAVADGSKPRQCAVNLQGKEALMPRKLLWPVLVIGLAMVVLPFAISLPN